MALLALFLYLADEPAGVGVWHFLGLGGTLSVGLGGSVIGGARWLGRHFDRLGDERKAEREQDAVVIAEQRKDYLASLDKRDQSFLKALEQQEAKCEEARQRDREARSEESKQRAEELKIFCRLAGIPAPGDTAKLRGAPGRTGETPS